MMHRSASLQRISFKANHTTSSGITEQVSGIGSIALGTIFIGCGLLLLFYGRVWLRNLVLLMGLLGGWALGATIVPTVFLYASLYLGFPSENLVPASLIGSFVTAIIGSILAYYAFRVGLYLTGAFVGFSIGTSIFTLISESVLKIMPGKGFLTICVLIGFVLTWLLEETIMIVASVTLATGMLTYGVDLLTNFRLVARIMAYIYHKDSNLQNIPREAGLIFLAILALAGCGFYFQCRRLHTDKEPTATKC